MMRIGVLHNAYRYRGGEDRVVEAESEVLKQAGHHVSQFIVDNRVAFASLGPGLANAVRSATGWNGSMAERLAAWVREEQLDLVHVHNLFPMITAAAPAMLASLRVPVVMTLHNFRLICAAGTLTRDGKACKQCIGHHPWRGVLHGCYRGSHAQSTSWMIGWQRARRRSVWSDAVDRFIAPSSHVRDLHVEAGFRAERITLRPHFTDMEPGKTVATRKGVLFVTRVEQGKGVREVVEAWPTDGPELTIVGTGPERTRAEAVAGTNVRFVGQQSKAEVASRMADAAVCLSASTLPETFGLTPIEAAACSLPTVAFASGGVSRLIENRVTGRLIQPGDVQSLVDAAVALERSPRVASAMGEAAGARYKRLYSPQAGLASLENIYQQVLSGSSRGAA